MMKLLKLTLMWFVLFTSSYACKGLSCDHDSNCKSHEPSCTKENGKKAYCNGSQGKGCYGLCTCCNLKKDSHGQYTDQCN